MAFTVPAQTLRDGLNRIKGSVAGKSSMPVLANVLLQVDHGTLTLASNNLEVCSIVTTECGSKEEWATTVPAKLLIDWVATIKGDIELSFDERTQTLYPKSGKSTIEIKCIDADEFPSLNRGSLEQVLTMPAWKFSEALSRVVNAAAKENTNPNPVLQGVYIECANNVLTFSAIDGYRLNQQKREVKSARDFAVIVPASALSSVVLGNVPKREHDKDLIVSLIRDSGDSFGQIAFQYGDAHYYLRIIDGKFPDVERFIPTNENNDFHVTVSVAELQSAVKRVALTAQAAGNIVVLSSTNEGDGYYFDLGANAAEIGKSSEQVALSLHTDFDERKIALNINYLQDALAVVTTDSALIRLGSPNSPIVIHSANQAEGFALVMPMRLP
jgi:DNA polymerase-3 subunit beta